MWFAVTRTLPRRSDHRGERALISPTGGDVPSRRKDNVGPRPSASTQIRRDASCRRGVLRRLGASVVSLLVGMGLVACGVLGGFPGQVTTPDVVGLVASITTDPDSTAHVVLTSGQTVVVGRSDRSLGGLAGPGDLLFLGSQPDPWNFAGHKSEKPDCYWISASRAYSEQGTVVLVFEEWPGVGVRLPKAPGYDDSKHVTADSQGRQVYSAIGPIELCTDVEGRINGVP